MAVSGTITTQLSIIRNFDLSGLSESNLSTINITDENGLDVSECFGIETRIIKVDGDNVTLTGDCDTSLEIVITEGIAKPVVCDFIRYTQDGDGLLTFFFSDGSSTDNTHPDCCTALGFTPEIGEGNYYVCRWRDEIDPTDCNNYTLTGEVDVNGYQIFEFVTGGTTTIVPSAECCYQNNLVDETTPEGIRCVVETVDDPCNGLILVEPVPLIGLATFIDPQTNVTTDKVPTSECCSVNGLNSTLNSDGTFTCFNSLTIEKPTVTFTNDTCCEPDVVTLPCQTWRVFVNLNPGGEEVITLEYLDCNGIFRNPSYIQGTDVNICVQSMLSVNVNGTPITGTPVPNGRYDGVFGYVEYIDDNCTREISSQQIP